MPAFDRSAKSIYQGFPYPIRGYVGSESTSTLEELYLYRVRYNLLIFFPNQCSVIDRCEMAVIWHFPR